MWKMKNLKARNTGRDFLLIDFYNTNSKRGTVYSCLIYDPYIGLDRKIHKVDVSKTDLLKHKKSDENLIPKFMRYMITILFKEYESRDANSDYYKLESLYNKVDFFK